MRQEEEHPTFIPKFHPKKPTASKTKNPTQIPISNSLKKPTASRNETTNLIPISQS